MADYDDIINEWQKVNSGFQPRLQAFKAIMGDGKGNIQGTQSNTVYVRVLNNALGTAPAVQAIEVYNDAAPLIDGLMVMIGYSHDRPRLLHVLSVNDQRTDISPITGSTVGVGLAPHGWQHGWLQPDPVAIYWRQINDLRVISNGTFFITVMGGVIPRSGVDLEITQQTFDLTSHVPVSGAIYTLISLDSTGAVVATDGINEPGRSSLTVADIPNTPAGNFRLAAVRLYAGQDYIHEDIISNDILDRRWPQESLTGTITPAGIALTNSHIIVGNSSNVGIDMAMSNDATLANTGALTLKNTGPGATGPIGDGTNVPVITIDAQGRVTALTSTAITGSGGSTILENQVFGG